MGGLLDIQVEMPKRQVTQAPGVHGQVQAAGISWGVILAEMELKALRRDKVTKGAYRYIGAGRARLGRVFRAPMTWGEHVGRCWDLGPALPSFLTWISAQRVPANIQIPYPEPPRTKRSDPLSDTRVVLRALVLGLSATRIWCFKVKKNVQPGFKPGFHDQIPTFRGSFWLLWIGGDRVKAQRPVKSQGV